MIEGDGTKIYIHANPKGPIQGIRIRYGHEALARRDAFTVHANTLEWLKELGFDIDKETLSRADLQVMTFRDITEYSEPLQHNRVVRRAKTHKIYGKNGKPVTTMTFGSSIELCIYDKREELTKKCDEVKMSLVVNDCLAGEFPDNLTRLEFRLRRDALRYFGINTMQDLLEKEHALVDFLTFDWFRILKDEKTANHSSIQEVDEIWEEVRDLFFEYFPGSVENRKQLEKNNSRREVKCTGESLVKQAVGCLATAVALAKGVFESEKEALSYIVETVSEKIQTLFQRTRDRVVELGIVCGVEPPKARDWHLDPRYASDCEEIVFSEFRAVYDEDLQYQQFRDYAVVGCPF